MLYIRTSQSGYPLAICHGEPIVAGPTTQVGGPAEVARYYKHIMKMCMRREAIMILA